MNTGKKLLLSTLLAALFAVPAAFAFGSYGNEFSVWGIVIGLSVFAGILVVFDIKEGGKEKEMKASGISVSVVSTIRRGSIWATAIGGGLMFGAGSFGIDLSFLPGIFIGGLIVSLVMAGLCYFRDKKAEKTATGEEKVIEAGMKEEGFLGKRAAVKEEGGERNIEQEVEEIEKEVEEKKIDASATETAKKAKEVEDITTKILATIIEFEKMEEKLMRSTEIDLQLHYRRMIRRLWKVVIQIHKQEAQTIKDNLKWEEKVAEGLKEAEKGGKNFTDEEKEKLKAEVKKVVETDRLLGKLLKSEELQKSYIKHMKRRRWRDEEKNVLGDLKKLHKEVEKADKKHAEELDTLEKEMKGLKKILDPDVRIKTFNELLSRKETIDAELKAKKRELADKAGISKKVQLEEGTTNPQPPPPE